jgi:transcriptional regulator with XRE-family HTH domain
MSKKKSPIQWHVVQVVRTKRIDHELTQLQLSLELGFSEGFVGKIESKNLPDHYNIDHLNKLARIFKCSPQDFLPKKPM